MNRVIGPVAHATLLEMMRSRMLWLVAAVLVVSLGLASFLQQVSMIEAAQIQGAAVGALLRAAAAFLVVSFVVMSMVREFNDKVFELMLAQPWPRAVYLFGKFVGFAGAAIVLAVILSLPLFLFVSAGRIPVWSLSLACELVILTAMSLFFVITLTHVVPALAAVLGFYLLARSLTAMQIIAAASETSVRWSDRLADWIVSGMAWVLPRFDQMTQTEWLVGAPPTAATIANVVAQTIIYAVLALSAAQFDLHRQDL